MPFVFIINLGHTNRIDMTVHHFPSAPGSLLLSAVLALVLVACKPDEPVEPTPAPPVTAGTLKVVIRPTWNGSPFQMNAVYNNVSDYRVKVEGLVFYLGAVRLTNSDGAITVKDIEIFDLRHNGDTVTWTGIAPGTYTELLAGLGVPQALNDANPIDYPPGHPLDLARGTYWNWSAAYRFLQFDGRYDLDPAGTNAPAQLFSMHTGMNVCYTEFQRDLPTPVVVTAGSTTTLVINMAIDRFFFSDTDTLDLATENQSHGSDPTHALALELTGNAVSSITIE